uniref:Delta(14)-sterol reductase ERG24 n=1 Tax=Attheya septentrionalis TaxID=420275 RepID=A0A7S2U759_9STRA|mmetsp:Transcript_12770/g.23093  ORF Transcript_12770/g.23093 Transcript_12770/m.23093 type:complete len:453 (+) Transcript_12770:128-1486(+)
MSANKVARPPSKTAFEYEFGGPVGALATTLFLPVMTLLLCHWASIGGLSLDILSPKDKFWDAVLDSPVLCPGCQDSARILMKCMGAVVSWFAFQVVLERILPCELVQGAPLPDGSGKRLTYRINGHLAFWVTFLIATVGWPRFDDSSSNMVQFGRAPLELLYDYCSELALATILCCAILSVYLYTRSFADGLLLAKGGQSGNAAYDFFMGRELNPRWFSFDWKEFCELRPGLIGWALLNGGFLLKQYETLGYVSGSMLLINVFQAFYVWDAVYQERAILTTMDITTDGFGFMLCFGDLAWVPFTYSLPAHYLVDHDPDLSVWALMAIVACFMLGYSIFRGANGEKNAFRQDPNAPEVQHLQYLQTKRGTKLLTSGWWGMARKINYTGDWIMGLSWCLVCGFDSIVPYYYAIYFAILLVHRSIRDDHMCHEKYGDDWIQYKKLVPYRFIPGIL